MPGVFSFLGSPMQNVVKRAHDMLPSIEKVLAVFSDENTGGSRILVAHRESDGVSLEEINSPDSMKAFDTFRNKTGKINWYAQEEVPFEVQKKSASPKIDVFKELENTVLLLRYKNTADDNYDLLFYYFNADTSNFGVSADNRSLTTEHKTIISTMLYNAVKTQIKEHEHNKASLKMLNNNMQNALYENKHLKAELEKEQKRYNKKVSDYSLHILEEITSEIGIPLRLSAEALEKLVAYGGAFRDLRKILLQAAQFSITMQMGSAAPVQIESTHINTHLSESGSDAPVIVPASRGVREERFAKTRLILNEMETAAKILSSRSVKLTSENLARSLAKPKSAAAISDQLSKHRDRIITLFDENPDQWAIIRKKFRPIQNIVNR